jgi:hypothetical protein
MRTFTNPSNGYQVQVGAGSIFGAFMLGPIWYAIKGAGGLALAYLILAVLGFAAAGVGALLVHLIFVVGAPAFISKSYLGRGWLEGSNSSPSVEMPACKAPARHRGLPVWGWVLSIVLLLMVANVIRQMVA